MKQKISIVCFLLAVVMLGMAYFYADATEEVEHTSIRTAPVLFSEIDPLQYVSLPVLESITIYEDFKETESVSENEEKYMNAFGMLVQSSERLSEVRKDCTVIINVMISKDGEFLKRCTEIPIGMKKDSLDERIYDSLINRKNGESMYISDVSFMDETGVDVSISIVSILNMPYPVTDQYMKSHTEYDSFDEMVRKLEERKQSEKRESQREETIHSLLETVINKTTFVSIPESLTGQEFQVLKKENPSIYYSEAEKSIKRLLVIDAFLKKYQIANKEDMDKRWNHYLEENPMAEGIIDYEKERLNILLYEEDVVNLIYKNVEIINAETSFR